MAARYQVRIKDTSGVAVALLTEWRRLEYTKRVDAPDNHTLVLDGNGRTAALLLPEDSLDYQVEVWRSDPALGIAPYLEYEGFHRTTVDEVTSTGLAILTSYGRGYDDLLDRRAILYPSGSSGSAKSGAGETVMKAYVNENAGAGATVPPRLFDGVTQDLTVEASAGGGSSWTGARSFRNLLEVVQEIAHAALVDFKVVGTGPAAFEFQAHAYPWGADRSTLGLSTATGLNAAGYAPVVFSLGFGNMGSAMYSRNRSQEANAIIMLGQGLEADREIVQRQDATAIAVSPWNRREITRNANQESTTAGLNAAGDALLFDLQAQETFSFTVLQTAAVKYGRDYFVGDIVEARFKSVQRRYQIIGATVTVEQGRETISIEVQQGDA